MKRITLRPAFAGGLSLIAPLAFAASMLVATPVAAGCDHPYFPMSQGEKYVYTKSGFIITEVLTKVEGNSFTFQMTTTAKGGPSKGGPLSSLSSTGQCSEDGLTMSVGSMTSSGTRVTVLKHSGSDFGTPAQMKVGGSWGSTMTSEMVHGDVTVTYDTTRSNRVVASEKVKVPAGVFDALRIEAAVHGTMTASGKGAANIPKRPPTDSKETTWVVKGIGIVKQQSSGSQPGDPSFPAMELVSFSK
jgi:hypothetical protein